MMSNIYFVGLMGAGKTTVGKVLAKHFNMIFIDTDNEVERKTGVKIPVIFELEGEAGFRKRETIVLEELCQIKNVVLATGGGIVLMPENRQLLKLNGKVIYLRATVHELWQRTRHDKNRPLLQTPNPKLTLEQLFKQRDPLYREIADFIVDTGGQPVSTIVHQIEKLIGSQNDKNVEC